MSYATSYSFPCCKPYLILWLLAFFLPKVFAQPPQAHVSNAQAATVTVKLPPSSTPVTHVALVPTLPFRSDHQTWSAPLLTRSASDVVPLVTQVSDTKLILRVAQRVVRTVEISESGSLHTLSEWTMPHAVERLAATEGAILVADAHNITLVDARDGAIRRTFIAEDSIVAVAMDAKTAVIAMEKGELLFLSFSDPLSATKHATLAYPPAAPIALTPTRVAYLHGSTLHVNTIDETTLTVRAFTPLPLDAPGVELKWMGDELVIFRATGTTIVNFTAEDGLRWASHLDRRMVRRPSPQTSVGITTLAVHDGSKSITLIDAAIPQHQEVIGFLPASEDGALVFVRADRFLVQITSTAASVWDLSALPALTSNEHFAPGEGVNLGGQRRAYLDKIKKLLYVADWFSGLHIYDISVADRPRLLSSLHTPGSSKGVVVRGSIAYVADDDKGLRVVDVSDVRQPQEIAALMTPGLAYTPVLDGNLLFLASHRGGFQIINIEEPAQPRLISNTSTPGKAWSLALRDRFAYVACSEGGIAVYDVRDAAAPVLLGAYTPGGNAEEIVVDGTRAYVAFFDDGVHILDISRPATPQLLAKMPTRGNARGLALRGQTLYVADWLAGLRVLDVQDARQPQVIADIDTPGAAWGVNVLGDNAYVQDWWGGLATLNIADPRNVRVQDRFPSCNRCSDIDVDHRYAYVAAGSRGVQIFDIKNALNPTWITGINFAQQARVLARAGETLFVAGVSEINVVETRDPFRPRRRSTIEACASIDWIRARLDAIAVGCGDSLRIFDFDTTRAGLKLRAEFFGSFVDAATIQKQWVGLTASGLIAPLDVQHAPIFAREIHLPLPLTLRRVHSADGRVVLIADEQVVVLKDDEHGLNLHAQSDIALPKGSSLLDDDTLAIAHSDGITLYHIREDGHVVELSHYPLSRPAHGLAVQNGYLYTATSELIAAVRMLPKWPVTDHSATQITLALPSSLAAGRYALAFLPAGGQPILADAPVNVSAFQLNQRVPSPLQPDANNK